MCLELKTIGNFNITVLEYLILVIRVKKKLFLQYAYILRYLLRRFVVLRTTMIEFKFEEYTCPMSNGIIMQFSQDEITQKARAQRDGKITTGSYYSNFIRRTSGGNREINFAWMIKPNPTWTVYKRWSSSQWFR